MHLERSSSVRCVFSCTRPPVAAVMIFISSLVFEDPYEKIKFASTSILHSTRPNIKTKKTNIVRIRILRHGHLTRVNSLAVGFVIHFYVRPVNEKKRFRNIAVRGRGGEEYNRPISYYEIENFLQCRHVHSGCRVTQLCINHIF